MSKYSEYEYRNQPGFDMNTSEGAYQAIPMKTLVIHCFDHRAAEIPQAVAAYFGDGVYRGENILDENGLELDPREHCLSRPMRVDALRSL
jgi:carbonic anhydrase